MVADASAGSLSSPALQTIGGQLECVISNVGTTPVRFTVTLYSSPDGAALTPSVDTCAVLLGALPAGQTCVVSLGAPVAARCTVEASSSKVRALLRVLNSGEIPIAVPLTRK
jgi:hypothetical protein